MATLYSNDFSVDNSGTHWQEGQNPGAGSSFTISGGQATLDAASPPKTQITTTTAHTAVANCKVTATRRTADATQDDGICVRHFAPGTDTYYVLNYFTNSNAEVYRYTDTVSTLVGSRNSTHANGDIWALEVSGTGDPVTLKVFKNGVQQGADLSDSNADRIVAAGFTGFQNWKSLVNAVFDDFLVEDLAPAGTYLCFSSGLSKQRSFRPAPFRPGIAR